MQWNIHADALADMASSAIYALADSATSSGVAYNVEIGADGTTLNFNLDTLIAGVDFWVELQGAGFSSAIDDQDFSISDVKVYLVDANHTVTAPWAYLHGSVDFAMVAGKVDHFQVLDLQSTTDVLEARVQQSLDEWRAKYQMLQDLNAVADELWLRVSNNQGYFFESIDKDALGNEIGTLITRKYRLSNNAVVEVNIHGVDMSIVNRQDPDFEVTSVAGTVAFSGGTTDHNVATFNLDLHEKVVDGWVEDLTFNGVTFDLDGLQLALDSELKAVRPDLTNGIGSSDWTLKALVDALGWTTFEQDLAPYVQVNADGTEITVQGDTNLGWHGELIISGSGFSADIADTAFHVDQVVLRATDAQHGVNDPLFFLSNTFTSGAIGGGAGTGATFAMAGHVRSWKGGAALVGAHFTVNGQKATVDTDGAYVLSAIDDDDGVVELEAAFSATANQLQASISLTDVLGALKVYLGKPLPAEYDSPYKYVAADFEGDGDVDLSDVLGLLKYYLHKPVVAQPAWAFVDAAQLIDGLPASNTLGQALSRTHATPASLSAQLLSDSTATVDLVGVLRGDLDGSWAS